MKFEKGKNELPELLPLRGVPLGLSDTCRRLVNDENYHMQQMQYFSACFNDPAANLGYQPGTLLNSALREYYQLQAERHAVGLAMAKKAIQDFPQVWGDR